MLVAVKEYKAGYDSSSQKFIRTQTSNGAVIYRTSLSDTTIIDPASPGTGTLYKVLPNITLLGINPPVTPMRSTVTAPANNATNQIFLPKISYTASAGATKYFVSVETTDGGTDVVNKYDNGTYLDYFLTYELQPQIKYYVKITPANVNGEATGCATSSFTTGTPVANDNYSAAEVVAASQLPLTKNVDGSFASDSEGPVTCNGTEVANDRLWYELTDDGGNITIKVTPIYFWNPQIVVKENSCTNTACLLNVNPGSYGVTETAVITNSVVGRKYYVNIGTASPFDFTEGAFTLSISTSNLAINESNQNKSLKIYPIPVKDVLNVQNLKDNSAFDIFVVTGRMVIKGIYKKNLHLQNLKAGKYILKTEEGSVLKFIKN